MQGRVKTLGQTHGYGFIGVDEGDDYFFHASAVVGGIPIEDLRVGDHVVFEPARSGEGRRVARVVRRAVLTGAITMVRSGGKPGCGYGFLRPLAGGEERFFHFSRLGPSGLPVGELFGRLRVGDLVCYRESPGNREKKARAVDVLPLPEAHPQEGGDQNPAPHTHNLEET
jgi:cold shock CspA family protein